MNYEPQDYITSLKEGLKSAEFRASVAYKMVSDTGIGKDCRIVDLGCGLGQLILKLEQNGYQNIWGIDASEQAVTQVGQKTGTAFVYHLNFESHPLPFEDGFVDVVACLEVFEHLYDPLKVLNEIFRILRPGGLAILSFPNEYRLGKRLRFLLGKSISSPLKVGGHVKLFNRATAIEFVRTKLEVLEMMAIGDERVQRIPALIEVSPSLFAKWFFVMARKS